jgi:hypothetical protein
LQLGKHNTSTHSQHNNNLPHRNIQARELLHTCINNHWILQRYHPATFQTSLPIWLQRCRAPIPNSSNNPIVPPVSLAIAITVAATNAPTRITAAAAAIAVHARTSIIAAHAAATGASAANCKHLAVALLLFNCRCPASALSSRANRRHNNTAAAAACTGTICSSIRKHCLARHCPWCHTAAAA